jgi:hypothetical protein
VSNDGLEGADCSYTVADYDRYRLLLTSTTVQETQDISPYSLLAKVVRDNTHELDMRDFRIRDGKVYIVDRMLQALQFTKVNKLNEKSGELE